MGLSNNERFTRIVYGIKRISDMEIPKGLFSEEKNKIKELIDNLWPTFMRGDSKNAFWILGGDFSSESLGETSLLTAAFENHKEKDELPESDDNFYTCKNMLDPNYICNDQELTFFLTLWGEVENFIYALTRYEDDFKNNLRAFEDNIRKLQGFLFKIVSCDKRYSKVWMQCHLYKKIFVNKDDFMGKWLVSNNLQHNLRIGVREDEVISYKDVFDMFQKWQFIYGNEIPLFDKIVMTLKMMGRRFHYQHQHKSLIEALKNEKDITPEQIVEIENILKDCVSENEEYDKNSREDYKRSQFCFFTRKSL